MAETIYGIVSDIHLDRKALQNTLKDIAGPQEQLKAVHSYLDGRGKDVETAVQLLKGKGAQAIILNGDLGDVIHTNDDRLTTEMSRYFITEVIRAAAGSGLPVYAQPGSHELVDAYLEAIEHVSRTHKNLVSALDARKRECPDHHLVFLPGSDTVSGGQFILRYEETPTGPRKTGHYTIFIDDNPVILSSFDALRFTRMRLAGLPVQRTYCSNPADLEQLVSSPDKTIVVCHVPALFKGERGVDYAYFATAEDGSIIPGVVVEEMIREKHGKDKDGKSLTQEQIQKIAAESGLNLRHANGGNTKLRELYEKLGIRKAVSGHIHEAGHNAHNFNTNPVTEGELTDNLFWNSGHFDAGQMGLLRINDGKVSYHNLYWKSPASPERSSILICTGGEVQWSSQEGTGSPAPKLILPPSLS